MSDNRRVYRRIISSLRQLYPPNRLNGHQLRHLNTLAGMMAGIVQSKSCHFVSIADTIPGQTQTESRAKRVKRFTQNNAIDAETFFMPFIQPLVAALSSRGSVTLAIDASQTGRHCMTLLVSLIYRKRAIPLVWTTVKGSKGHLPEQTHLDLLAKVQALLPAECHVTLVGDGEFDGVHFQATVTAIGWEYVCRTAKNRIISDEGDEFALADISLSPGQCVDMPAVHFAHADYGPVLVIAWWRKGEKAPIYLVSNMECVLEACYTYRHRFGIETFFSDQKSRGFNLHKSHLANPERIARLLLAACLAYIWVIYLGTKAFSDGKAMRQIHRANRCDLSLFQLGLRYLKYLLNKHLSIPFSLLLPT